MSLVYFEKVTKSYDKYPILNQIDLKIFQGEFIFITGRSGSGKTTFIKLLCQLEKPNSGKIIVNKKQYKRKISLNNNIGIVYQDQKLLENRTVFENIIIPLQIRGYRYQDIIKKVKTIADYCMITHTLQNKILTLSGGEKQLVAIARAIIHDPKILIADEPTSNLDRLTTLKVMNVIHKLNIAGVTTIIATHDIEMINTYESRVLLIKNQKVSTVGK